MCTRMYTFPDVHIRVHPTSRKEQKYPDQYTQAHPPPVGYTRYFHPRCVPPCAPTTRYVQQSVLPQDVSIPGTRGCKREQEASPEGTRKRRMKGPSVETWRGRAPVRPPSALTVDAGLVRHGSAFGSPVPSELSAWSWPGSTRLAWTQSSGGCGDAAEPRAASRAVPQDPPPKRPAPGGRGRQRRALVPRVRAAGAGVGMAQCRAATTFMAKEGPRVCVCVWMVTCRPRSWRSVCGSALGRGRDCALAAEEVWE